MIRVVIADDEPPARAKIRKLLEAEADVEVVAEAADGREAVDALRRTAPDLVFLDIRMPRRDGFDVIDEVGVENTPLVVFVTAYDEHAIRAFEVHAFDYLLKPFAPNRFRRVLERVRARLARESPGDLAGRLQEVLASVTSAPRYLRRVQARIDDERETFVMVDRIDLVRAEGNYVRLYTDEGESTRRTTLTALVERLDPEKFLRINRSEVVRLDAVREIQPWFHGDYQVILRNGEKLRWSRRYRAKVKDDL